MPMVACLPALLLALFFGTLDVIGLHINKTDATHYTVTSEVIDLLLAEAPRLPLRAVSETRGKRAVGIKLLDIKPDSVGAKLGFRDGDVVTAVNDLPLAGTADFLSAYAKTKNARTLTFSITRRNEPVAIVWEVLTGPRPGSVERPPKPAGASAPDARVAEVVSQIQRIDDTHFKITRTAVAAIDAGMVARSARIIPEVRDGGVAGFRLFGIRPGSLLHALGLQNGDTVLEMNGVRLTSPDDVFKAQAAMRKSSMLRLSIDRLSQPLVIEVQIH